MRGGDLGDGDLVAEHFPDGREVDAEVRSAGGTNPASDQNRTVLTVRPVSRASSPMVRSAPLVMPPL